MSSWSYQNRTREISVCEFCVYNANNAESRTIDKASLGAKNGYASMRDRVRPCLFYGLLILLAIAASVDAQTPASTTEITAQEPPPHDHAAMLAANAKRWQLMWDGVVFTTFNYQGGSRGDTEVTAQNWLMVMGSRQLGSGTLALSGMATLEPVTVGAAGYAHLFQLGETYQGLPVTDRQHPHDLFMQLEAKWRQPIGKTELSIAGGPVGAPAFGPTPFMHRLSASENPTAPLTHHTFDSTHIAMGTITAGVRRGPFLLEASAFHGREPDEHRYNLETGALDSRAARVTWEPGGGFAFQVSRAFLYQPELLEPGNQKRTNASMSWQHMRADRAFTAITIMTGRVSRTYTWTGAVLAEGVHWIGNQAIYGRYEGAGIETEHLMFPTLVHPPHPGEFVDSLYTITLGAARRIAARKGIDVAIGGDATFYRVPARLQPTHGERPASAHVFLRIRPLGDTASSEHHH